MGRGQGTAELLYGQRGRHQRMDPQVAFPVRETVYVGGELYIEGVVPQPYLSFDLTKAMAALSDVEIRRYVKDDWGIEGTSPSDSRRVKKVLEFAEASTVTQKSAAAIISRAVGLSRPFYFAFEGPVADEWLRINKPDLAAAPGK